MYITQADTKSENTQLRLQVQELKHLLDACRVQVHVCVDNRLMMMKKKTETDVGVDVVEVAEKVVVVV